MQDLARQFDAYVWRARLQPVLLVILPAILAALAWMPHLRDAWSSIWVILVACGLPWLLAHLGRDRGKTKEPELYARWGGMPTTQRLRHRDAQNETLLARRHAHLKRLAPDLDMPTAEEEQRDPKRADQAYEAVASILQERTRNRKQFPRVFDELTNYGFRRNLWGLKPFGVLVSLVSVASVVPLVVVAVRSGASVPALPVITGVIDLALALIWIFWVTPVWIRITAEAYAEQLLAACERL